MRGKDLKPLDTQAMREPEGRTLRGMQVRGGTIRRCGTGRCTTGSSARRAGGLDSIRGNAALFRHLAGPGYGVAGKSLHAKMGRLL